MKNCTENHKVCKTKSNSQGFENHFFNKKYSLKEIVEILPAIVYVNSINDFSLKYINNFGKDKFSLPMEKIAAESENFIQEIFEPGTFDFFSKSFIRKIQENDFTQIISFFQKAKVNNSDYKWFFTTSRFLKDSNEFISVSQEVSGTNTITKAIAKLLDESLYFRNNLKKFECLTKREKQILKMITQRLSTKKIAEILYISPQTVNTHRKNIRKKLELKKGTDWEYFASAFEL